MFGVMTMDEVKQLPTPQREEAIGKMANQYAGRNVFEEYRSRKAENTLRAHAANLAVFCDFLAMVEIHRSPEALMRDPQAWQFVTHGLVASFRAWMLRDGYAISTVGHKLATLKKYASLAHEAGALELEQMAMIRTVKGYSAKEGKRVDERRDQTRKSSKKAVHEGLGVADAWKLRTEHPDTPQGRRDRVICCLGLDHGLRASELEGLQVSDVDLKRRRIHVYRKKTDLHQDLRLEDSSFDALLAYLECDEAPAMGPLLRGSRKDGSLDGAGMSASNISKRVKDLGKRILGKDDLTAHDLRATFATHGAIAGADVFAIRDAGGWKTTTMVNHYVKAAGHGEVSNARMKLPKPPMGM